MIILWVSKFILENTLFHKDFSYIFYLFSFPIFTYIFDVRESELEVAKAVTFVNDIAKSFMCFQWP